MTNRAPLLSSATPFNRIVDLTRNPLLWTQVFSTLHSSWGFPLSYPSRSEDDAGTDSGEPRAACPRGHASMWRQPVQPGAFADRCGRRPR